jgi:hypothetical protein
MLNKIRSFVFFWQTESGKFIFESARERKGDIGKNLSSEEICRKRLKEGNKKTFDWNKIKIYPIEITEWVNNFKFPTQTKDPITWTENSILRKFLIAEGFPVLFKEGKEKHQGDMIYAIKKINKYLFGTETAKPFKTKPETTDRLLKYILDRISGKIIAKSELLYGVATGAGKTADYLFACELVFDNKKINKHLFVTSMPDTIKDLCRDVRDGIPFQNIIVWVKDNLLPELQYMLKDRVKPFSEIDSIKNYEKHNHVICLGVQDARGQDGNKYSKLLKKLKFGMYGKDEVHTNQSEFSKFSKNVEPNIDYFQALYMTGTPEKFVLEYSKFTEDNWILFLMNDVYKEQTKGNKNWQDYPWRNIMVNDFDESQRIVAEKMDLEDKHLMNHKKLWSWDQDNDCLVHEEGVKELLKIRLGVGAFKSDERCFWGPGSGLSRYKKKTGVICIENGESNKKTKYIAKLIEEITGVRCFSAHDVNGFDAWLNFCNHNDADSIYVTHDKDMTGKNNMWMNWGWFSLNISSVVRTNQGLGRFVRKLIIDGINQKPDIYVFFDNPETALAVTLDTVEAVSTVTGSTKQIAEEIFKIASYWFEGKEKWCKAKIPDLIELINRLDPYGDRGLSSLRHINSNIKCPAHLFHMLSNCKGNIKIKETISDKKAGKGKNKIYESNAQKNKKKINFDQLYKENLLASLRKLAKAVIVSDGKIFDIDSILENPKIKHGDINLSLEEICKTNISFFDLRKELTLKNISKKSVNKSLDRVRARYEN